MEPTPEQQKEEEWTRLQAENHTFIKDTNKRIRGLQMRSNIMILLTVVWILCLIAIPFVIVHLVENILQKRLERMENQIEERMGQFDQVREGFNQVGDRIDQFGERVNQIGETKTKLEESFPFRRSEE